MKTRKAARRRKTDAGRRQNHKERVCGGETEAVTVFVARVAMLAAPLNLSLFAYMHRLLCVLVWRPGSPFLNSRSRSTVD